MYLMELLDYLLFSFRLFNFAPLSFPSVLWFRQRVHLVFDQVNYFGICKCSSDIKAVLSCKEMQEN